MTTPESTGASRLPHRVSLVAQTTAILKSEIQEGVWSGRLPGEHELCARLHVSRITLRKALNELQREGWVRAGQGRRREIVHAPRTQLAASGRVVLLTPLPLHNLHPLAIYWMDCLREHLSEAGYNLEIHAGPGPFGGHLHKVLEGMAEQLRPAGWVLYRSTAALQRWFSERALPCVITGSRHPGVELPSVDIDYRATCRHAGGQFLARGHRQLVLLNPESGAAGDLESEQGFQEAARRPDQEAVQVAVVRHDGTVEGICRKLDLLLERAHRPTAFLVSRPVHVLTVLGHLMRRGLRLPQDAALISRDDDSFMEHVVPTVARYSSSPTVFARRLSSTVLEMVRGTTTASGDFRIMPRFLPGQTLG